MHDIIPKRISVYVTSNNKSPWFYAQWVDPATGRHKTRSLKTDNPREADRRLVLLEQQVNEEDYQRRVRDEAVRLAGESGEDPGRRRNRGTLAPKMGRVYFVESGGLYKIGYAVDLVQRLAQIRTCTPAGIDSVRTILTDDAAWLEKALHARFADRLVRGEWFALSAEDLAEVDGVDVWLREGGPMRLLPVEMPPRPQA